MPGSVKAFYHWCFQYLYIVKFDGFITYNKSMRSISFLGKQVVELLFWNETILIEIGSLNHFLKNVVVLDFS